jgi:ABC-type uncharacterized transport system substrate-binding protein
VDRRTILWWLTLGTLSVPLAARAQPQAPPWTIAVLWEVREVPPRFVPLVDWLREDLKAQEFNDRDLHFEVRQVEGNSGLPDAARELIRIKPRLIWTSTDIVARVVRAETSDMPIVFGVAADPVREGVVQSWAKPGGNVTGVAVHGHVPGKRLELLKEMVPGLRRVLVTPDPAIAATTTWLTELREAASRLSLSLVEHVTVSKADIERWPETVKKERIDGMVHIVNTTVNHHLEDTIRALHAARVPDISYYLPAVENRWVMAAYAVPHREAWRMSAHLVGRILRGAKPQDLPIQSADIFALHINLGIAKERRVQIPRAVLLRATKRSNSGHGSNGSPRCNPSPIEAGRPLELALSGFTLRSALWYNSTRWPSRLAHAGRYGQARGRYGPAGIHLRLAGSLLAAPVAAGAQQAGKGVPGRFSFAYCFLAFHAFRKAFRQGLRETRVGQGPKHRH